MPHCRLRFESEQRPLRHRQPNNFIGGIGKGVNSDRIAAVRRGCRIEVAGFIRHDGACVERVRDRAAESAPCAADPPAKPLSGPLSAITLPISSPYSFAPLQRRTALAIAVRAIWRTTPGGKLGRSARRTRRAPPYSEISLDAWPGRITSWRELVRASYCLEPVRWRQRPRLLLPWGLRLMSKSPTLVLRRPTVALS
jgi:hypothetical protein